MLAFLRWRTGAGGSPAIYLQSMKGGEPRQLAVDNRQLAGIAWSADGRRLIFSSDCDDEYKLLWEVSNSGGQPVAVGGGRRHPWAAFFGIVRWPPAGVHGARLFHEYLAGIARSARDGSTGAISFVVAHR
jgi:hypothetical protein